MRFLLYERIQETFVEYYKQNLYGVENIMFKNTTVSNPLW